MDPLRKLLQCRAVIFDPKAWECGQTPQKQKIEGGDLYMSNVRLKDGESFESIVRRFKKSCEKAGILAELRKRECYEKPSVKRKKQNAQAKKRMAMINKEINGL